MQLVATGAQDKYLIEDPQVTFFKIVYRRHTPFSIESKVQTFTTKADFGKTVTCVIGRLGDLVNKIILFVHLPENDLRQPIHHLIDHVELRIGDQLIDKQSGEYIWLDHQLYTHDLVALDKLTTSAAAYLPLTFWFNKKPGQSLPLVALSNSLVQVSVRFKHADQFYPPEYKIAMEYNYGHIKIGDVIKQRDKIGKVTAYNPVTREIQYITYDPPFTNHSTINGIRPVSGSIKITKPKPKLIHSYFLVDYVYLGQEERTEFVTGTHELLIEQVQQTSTLRSQSPNIRHNMAVRNNVKAMYWVAQLDRADAFNYTSEAFTRHKSLILSSQILFNGQPRNNVADATYYNYVQPYKHGGNSPPKGIQMYSFSVNPASTQPSGTANLSKIDSTQLILRLSPFVTAQQTASIRSYAVSHNVLRISLGSARLLFC